MIGCGMRYMELGEISSDGSQDCSESLHTGRPSSPKYLLSVRNPLHRYQDPQSVPVEFSIVSGIPSPYRPVLSSLGLS